MAAAVVAEAAGDSEDAAGGADGDRAGLVAGLVVGLVVGLLVEVEAQAPTRRATAIVVLERESEGTHSNVLGSQYVA